MDTGIVHEHNVSPLESWSKKLFDVGSKYFAGHRAFAGARSDAQLTEIGSAVRQASARGLGWQTMTDHNFPLPSCAALACDEFEALI